MTMRGIHMGSLEIDGDETVSGMVMGDLHIAAGRTVTISGMVEGDVIAAPGAVVAITGMVGGRVIASGAKVTISGIVQG